MLKSFFNSISSYWQKPRYPPVQQYNQNDCGPACLLYVLSTFQIHLPLQELRKLAKTSLYGCTAGDLIQAAEKVQVNGQAFQWNENYLHHLPTPAILCVRKNECNHFIVLCSASRTGVQYMDPATGKFEKAPIKSFLKNWSGLALIFEPKPESSAKKTYRTEEKKTSAFFKIVQGIKQHALLFPIRNSLKKIKFRPVLFKRAVPFLKLLQPGWWMVLLLMASSFLTALVPAWVLQQLVDHFLLQLPSLPENITAAHFIKWMVGQHLHNIPLKPVGLLGILLALIPILWIQLFIKMKLSVQLMVTFEKRVMTDFFKKVLSHSIQEMRSYKDGDILIRAMDHLRIREGLLQHLTDFYLMIAVVLGSILASWVFFPPFGWTLLFFTAMMVLMMQYASTLNKKLQPTLQEKRLNLETEILDKSINHLIWHPVERHSFAIQRLTLQLNQVHLATKKLIHENFKIHAACDSLQRTTIVLLLCTGIYLTASHKISLGSFMAFFSIAPFLTQPLLHLLELIGPLQQCNYLMGRTLDFGRESSGTAQNATPEKTIEQDREKLNAIVFQEVDFRHGGQPQLFKNLTFRMVLPQALWLKGENGSGKTTLLELIAGVMEPDKGQLLFVSDSGEKIGKEIQQFIYIIPSRNHFTCLSILENILLGRNFEKEWIQKVCRETGVMKIAEGLPMGLQTRLDWNGRPLSAGQQKLVLLARALVGKPQLLLLDELRTHLDPFHTRQVERALRWHLQQGGSLIEITHEKKSPSYCNKTLVLEKGRIKGWQDQKTVA